MSKFRSAALLPKRHDDRRGCSCLAKNPKSNGGSNQGCFHQTTPPIAPPVSLRHLHRYHRCRANAPPTANARPGKAGASMTSKNKKASSELPVASVTILTATHSPPSRARGLRKNGRALFFRLAFRFPAGLSLRATESPHVRLDPSAPRPRGSKIHSDKHHPLSPTPGRTETRHRHERLLRASHCRRIVRAPRKTISLVPR